MSAGSGRPRLLVVDVTDRPRRDPAYGRELHELTARASAAATAAGFDVERVVSDGAALDGWEADAVLLMGGEDVDPALYGGEADYPGRDETFPDADRAQVALVRDAVEAGVPLVGICRGMQVINVALGGDLVQHLPHPGHLGADASAGMVAHAVSIDAASTLARVVGASTLDVQSSHHQAVGRPGRDLRIVARADDGTAEALEHVAAPVWAVQWHPEDVGSTGTVLADLLAAVRARIGTV